MAKNARPWGLAALLFLGIAASWMSTDAQSMQGVRGEPKFPPAGSSWVIAIKSSGGLKVPEDRQTIRSLGEQTWKGQKVLGYSDGSVVTYIDPNNLRLLARLRGDALIDTYDPGFGFEWPLTAGRSWVNAYRLTSVQSNQGFDVQMAFKVEAYEDVTVPAGTFKVFRVTSNDGGPFKGETWWSPELGIAVKSTFERTHRHFRGLGWRENVLVSYDLKP